MADVMVDTNIWCYYFDSTTSEHRKVVDFMDELLDEDQAYINTIILMECSHYLIKNLGPITGKERAELLISSGITIDELNLQDTKSAIDFLSRYSHLGIGGRDSTILATMKKLNLNALITHDKSFSKIEEIGVIDPID